MMIWTKVRLTIWKNVHWKFLILINMMLGIFYHQPSAGSYGSQFAWDSGWSVIGASTIKPESALRELQTVFKLQLDNGRISHEIIIRKGNNSFSRRMLTPLISGQFDEKNRSYFIDPPSFLVAAEVLYNRTKDKRVLDLLPSMEAYVTYLIEKRDLFGDGLVSIVHPWETGCDNAPYFGPHRVYDAEHFFIVRPGVRRHAVKTQCLWCTAATLVQCSDESGCVFDLLELFCVAHDSL